MGGIEKIVEKINSDVEAYEQVSLKDAKKQADFILDEYAHKAEYVSAVITDASKSSAERIIECANASATLIKRDGILAMKSSILDDVFNSAVSRIIEGDSQRYIDFMTSVLLKAAEDGQGIVVMNKEDRVNYGKRLIENANRIFRRTNLQSTFILSNETVNIKGGFVLKYGGVDINCSIESIIAEIRPRLESKAMRILFNSKKK